MPWHNKVYGGYARESAEALDNAKMAYNILSARGWSLLAFCGFWGNVGGESQWNPWRWQSDAVLSTNDTYYITEQTGHAYGLPQWDPAYKYIGGGAGYAGYGPNFSNQAGSANEGNAQIMFLDDTAVSSGQYFPNPNYNYQVTWEQYKAMTLETGYTYEYATRAWFHNYERGTWDQGRVISCEYFYNALSGYTPTPTGKIPIWLLFKMKKRNEGDIR